MKEEDLEEKSIEELKQLKDRLEEKFVEVVETPDFCPNCGEEL